MTDAFVIGLALLWTLVLMLSGSMGILHGCHTARDAKRTLERYRREEGGWREPELDSSPSDG